MFKIPKEYIKNHPVLGLGDENGAYLEIPNGGMRPLRCVASNGEGWEHVSVSKENGQLPNWVEMCRVKDFFWDEEDCVVQFHPKKSEYVNNAQVLHLWRKIGHEFETPPTILVGIK